VTVQIVVCGDWFGSVVLFGFSEAFIRVVWSRLYLFPRINRMQIITPFKALAKTRKIRNLSDSLVMVTRAVPI
jgi:hypothetical protein